MNVRMVDIALEAMREVDVLALVVDASVKPGSGRSPSARRCSRTSRAPVDPGAEQGRPRSPKPKLLPLLDQYQQAHPFVELVPISAVDGTNVDVLEGLFLQLPAGRGAALSAGLRHRSDRALLRRRRSSASRCCSSRTTSCRSRPRWSSTSSTSPSAGLDQSCTARSSSSASRRSRSWSGRPAR